MRRLRKFLALPAGERRLLLSAALGLIAMRLGLWLLPFRTMLRLPLKVALRREPKLAGTRRPPEKVGWAVHVAGRYVPGGRNCLVQALTAQFLLTRWGHPASLHIGVATVKDDTGRFHAHAWVESRGKIVTGGGGLSEYTELVSFPTSLGREGVHAPIQGEHLP